MLTSLKSKSQLEHQRVKLNISQLAPAKLAQTGEHQTGIEEIPSSTPTGVYIFFWTYFCYPFRANFVNFLKKN